MSDTIRKVVFASALPLALGATGRWGHQAVYVPTQQTLYVVGGQVVSSGSKVTNDVLVLPLDQDGATFSAGPSDGLPAHAFASATLSQDGESLVIMGGMTSSCSSDALTHTLSLTDSSQTWQNANPASFVRRRGAAAAWVDDGSTGGSVLVVGGVADTYSCSSSSYTYPATDIFQFPLSSSAASATLNLPSGLTGSELAVADFAFTRGTDGSLYLVGGQAANGDMVSLSTIGKWTVSKGWVSQSTSGDVPTGRVGASLVAHPSLDLLVLHGGSIDGAATQTLALLNTTSWAWSTPSFLQPPASSAVAYHTSVITPQGVMITAFGLGATGSPSSNVVYLDMRSSSTSNWGWKSTWSSDMLEAYSASASSSGTTTGVTTSSTSAKSGTSSKAVTNTNTDVAQSSSESGEKKPVTSIVVPVVIVALILIPLAIWFFRRKARLAKKRREARHFSFSSQEDEGDFRGAVNSLNAPSRRTKTQYGFGTDANEKEGNVFTDIAGVFKRFTKRRGSVDSTSSVAGEREMMSQANNQRVSRLDERTVRWEEIDFGLGRLDERAQGQDRRLSSALPLNEVASTIDPFIDPTPLIRLDSRDDESPRMGTALHDGQPALIPDLTVEPPTVPATPAEGIFQPSHQDGLDWNILAQEMQVRPAFRSISPTSTLRSHAHPMPNNLATSPTQMQQMGRSISPISPSSAVSPFDDSNSPLPHLQDDMSTPAPAYTDFPPPIGLPSQRSSGPPRLPSLDFSASRSPLDAKRPLSLSPSSPISPIPFPGNRAVSQPMQGRQLIGNPNNRRGSIPYHGYSAASSGSTTPTPASPDMNAARRSSNPTILSGPRPQSVPSSKPQERRESAMSKLRVMNLTEEDGSLESQAS